MSDGPSLRRRLLRRPFRTLLILAGLGFLALNALAYLHARAATHLGDGEVAQVEITTLSIGTKLRYLLTGAPMNKPRIWREPEVPFEDVVLESADGVRLAAWRLPLEDARYTVCLFHGYVETRSQLLEEVRLLRELGCETWLLDFRASGESEGRVTSIGWYEAADVAALVEEVERVSGEPPVLLGRSMGAVACMRALEQELVAPRALILESPFGDMLSTIENRFVILGAPSFPAAELMTFWGGRQLGFDAFAHRPIEYARAIDAPTLLHYGALDRRVAVTESTAIAENLRNGTTFVFAGAGHTSFARTAPEDWQASVAAFLATLDE